MVTSTFTMLDNHLYLLPKHQHLHWSLLQRSHGNLISTVSGRGHFPESPCTDNRSFYTSTSPLPRPGLWGPGKQGHHLTYFCIPRAHSIGPGTELNWVRKKAQAQKGCLPHVSDNSCLEGSNPGATTFSACGFESIISIFRSLVFLICRMGTILVPIMQGVLEECM